MPAPLPARTLVSVAAVLAVVVFMYVPVETAGYVGVEEPPDLEAIWVREQYGVNYIHPLLGGKQAAIAGDFLVDVMLIDVETGATVTKLYTTRYSGNVISEPITGLSSNGEGSLLVIAAGNRVIVMDVIDKAIVWNTSRDDFKYTIKYVEMSRDGSLIIAGSSEVGLLSLVEGKMLWRKDRGVSAAGFSLARGEVAVAGGDLLTVYTIDEGEVVWEKRFGKRVVEVDYDPGGLFIAVALDDGSVMLLEAYDGKKVWSLPLGDTAADMRYASEQLLALLLRNGTIVHIDPRMGTLVKTLSTTPDFRPAMTMVLNSDLQSFLTATGGHYAYYDNPNFAKLVVEAYPGTIITLEGKGGKGSWKVNDTGRLRIYATPGEYMLHYKLQDLPLDLRPIIASPPGDTLTIILSPGEVRELRLPTPFEVLARLTARGVSPTGYLLEIYYGEIGHETVRPTPEGVVDIFLVPGTYTIVHRDTGFNKTFELKPGVHIVIDLAKVKTSSETLEEDIPPETTLKQQTTPVASPTQTGTGSMHQTIVQSRPHTTTIQTTSPLTESTPGETLPETIDNDREEQELARKLGNIDINTLLLALIALQLAVIMVIVARRKK